MVNIDQFRWMVRRDVHDQLGMAVRELGARHVRAVGMLDDEMRFFTLTPADWKQKPRTPRLNLQTVTYVSDSLVDLGLAPMITTCFTPGALAAGDKTTFTTKSRISPPRDFAQWSGLIRQTVEHFIQRYGRETVRGWYFEVWNEPNLKDGFFEGTYDDFLRLWETTYAAIKSVDNELRVGGPSTARAEWIEPFLEWTGKHHCPPDYLIVHIYNNDGQFAALSPFDGPQEDRAADSPHYAAGVIAGTRRLLDKLAYTGEVHWNEWGRTWHPTDPLRETPVEAAWIVKTMSEVSQLADYFAYWCISDIYDQVGYVSTPFEGHYGMLNIHGLRKPSWHAHQLLSRLGPSRVAASLEGGAGGLGAIVTRNLEGGATLLYDCGESVTRREIHLTFPREAEGKKLTVTSVNGVENNILTRWKEMGSPSYPSRDELGELRAANHLCARDESPVIARTSDGAEAVVSFDGPGLLLIEW